jgi:hypothetical protein
MAVQTKMILITSDEDIIRRFSLDKTKNIHIIDLDNDDRSISSKKVNNNNISDLAFFAGLSELVCILYLYNSLKLKRFIYRIHVVIKYINVHLIHLIIVDQNQLK